MKTSVSHPLQIAAIVSGVPGLGRVVARCHCTFATIATGKRSGQMLVKLDCVAGAGECLGETLLALDQFESLL
jgi:hypothetical protein